MSNNKQSSVDFLISRLLEYIHEAHHLEVLELYEQSKKMHKEEIEEAFWNGSDGIKTKTDILKIAEQYYNETYK